MDLYMTMIMTENQEKAFGILLVMPDHVPMLIGHRKSLFCVILKYRCRKCEILFVHEGMWYSIERKSDKSAYGWACCGCGAKYELGFGMWLVIAEKAVPEDHPCRSRRPTEEEEMDWEEDLPKNYEILAVQCLGGKAKNYANALKMHNNSLMDVVADANSSLLEKMKSFVQTVADTNECAYHWLKGMGNLELVPVVDWRKDAWWALRADYYDEVYSNAAFSCSSALAGEGLGAFRMDQLDQCPRARRNGQLNEDEFTALMNHWVDMLDHNKLLSSCRLLAQCNKDRNADKDNLRSGLRMLWNKLGLEWTVQKNKEDWVVEEFEKRLLQDVQRQETLEEQEWVVVSDAALRDQPW